MSTDIVRDLYGDLSTVSLFEKELGKLIKEYGQLLRLDISVLPSRTNKFINEHNLVLNSKVYEREIKNFIGLMGDKTYSSNFSPVDCITGELKLKLGRKLFLRFNGTYDALVVKKAGNKFEELMVLYDLDYNESWYLQRKKISCLT